MTEPTASEWNDQQSELQADERLYYRPVTASLMTVALVALAWLIPLSIVFILIHTL